MFHDKKLLDMLQVLPHTSEVSKIKKMNILSSFQEIEFSSGATGQRIAQVLEHEGSKPQFVYWVVRGDILLYKKLLDTKQASLDFYNNQNQDKGDKDIGVCVSRLQAGHTLVGEDAALKNKELQYTIVPGDNLLVWRYPAKDVL